MGRFQPGHQKLGGRKPGSANKVTQDLKQVLLGAFDEVGGQEYLVWLAHKQPQSFCTLLGKVIPSEVNAALSVSGTLTTVQASEVVVVHHRIAPPALPDAPGGDGAVIDAEYTENPAQLPPRPVESVGQ